LLVAHLQQLGNQKRNKGGFVILPFKMVGHSTNIQQLLRSDQYVWNQDSVKGLDYKQ